MKHEAAPIPSGRGKAQRQSDRLLAHFQQKCSRGFVPENAQIQKVNASNPTKSGSDFGDDAIFGLTLSNRMPRGDSSRPVLDRPNSGAMSGGKACLRSFFSFGRANARERPLFVSLPLASARGMLFAVFVYTPAGVILGGCAVRL